VANVRTHTVDPAATVDLSGTSSRGIGDTTTQQSSRGASLLVAEQPGLLDRIVFGSAETGEPRAIATSLSAEELEVWTEYLRAPATSPGMSLAGADRHERPTASMWYSSDGGAAALLYRLHGHRGDDRCHALVGWHPDLTPRRALQMHGWEGWTGNGWTGPRLRRLNIDGSQGRHAQPRDLDAGAAQQQASLAAVVATVLRQPRRPVSIVSGPSDLAERAALLWGLYAVTGDLFDVSGEPPYTFSTFETPTRAGGHKLPRVIFIPAGIPPDTPSGAGDHPVLSSARRTVHVPVTEPDGRDDAYTYAAKAMVRCYVTGGVPAVQEWLDRRQVRVTHSVIERMHRVVETADMTMAPMPVRAPEPQAPEPHVPEPQLPEAAATPPEVWKLGDIELVALLGKADPDTVRYALQAVRGRRTCTSSTRRAEVRDLVVRNEFWERQLRTALPPPEVGRAIGDLARFAIAPADLRDDRAVYDILRLVAALDTSPIVIDSLVAVAVEYGEHAVLLEAVGLRWMREHGYPVAGAAPAFPSRTHDRLHEPRPERTHRRLLPAGRP
jgi:hypothetical protein